MSGMSFLDRFGVAPALFIAGVLALFGVIGSIIWFGIPGPDARHRFVAPSGEVAIELGEACGEAACRRVAILDETQPDGTRLRHGCSFELAEQWSVLLNAHPLWSADETSVSIVYAGADGQGGRFTLDFATDCTLTE